MQKSILIYFLTIVLSLGTLFFVTSPAFAENPENEKVNDYSELSGENKEKAKEIIENLNNQLSELGIAVGHSKLFTDLDEPTKKKAKGIFKDLREGKITRDEAHAKLEELGITLPKHDNIENLDDKTRDKAVSLVEDARLKLKELGLKLPKRFERFIKENE